MFDTARHFPALEASDVLAADVRKSSAKLR
jgi:hypothetical protein